MVSDAKGEKEIASGLLQTILAEDTVPTSLAVAAATG